MCDRNVKSEYILIKLGTLAPGIKGTTHANLWGTLKNLSGASRRSLCPQLQNRVGAYVCHTPVLCLFSTFFDYLVVPSFRFFKPLCRYPIPRGNPSPGGAQNTGCGKISDFRLKSPFIIGNGAR